MSFQSECDAMPTLRGRSKPGLRALKQKDASRVGKVQGTRLTTSVDIDDALMGSQPNAARWDYGVGQSVRNGETVHWIEIHPASGSHSFIEIQRKLLWLAGWLRETPLAGFPRQVVWVASGNCSFNARDPRLKKLSQMGLRFAGGRYTI